MKITVTAEFSNAEDAVAFIRRAQPTTPTLPADAVGITGDVAPPVKRTRKKAEPTPAVAGELASPAPAAPTSGPKLEDVQAAIEKVFEKRGVKTSIDLLSRYGVKRVRDMKPEQYAAFVAHAQRVIAGEDPAAVS